MTPAGCTQASRELTCGEISVPSKPMMSDCPAACCRSPILVLEVTSFRFELRLVQLLLQLSEQVQRLQRSQQVQVHFAQAVYHLMRQGGKDGELRRTRWLSIIL